MHSMILLNEEGSTIYETIAIDIQKLVNECHEDTTNCSTNFVNGLRINSLIVIAEGVLTTKQNVPRLSKKQIQVLQYLAQALTPEQIALKLGISKATVRMHIRALKKKFNTDSRDQMMAMAGTLGLCDPFTGKSNKI
jgi:DNA-binding CsgD family transcriptional regulator